MERVGLRDRPGQFFVVCRLLGEVRLLDGNDQEFSVPVSLVKSKDTRPKTVARREHVARREKKLVVDFSTYAEFINFLLEHRSRVHIYFGGRDCVKDSICDRYLGITGEELDPRFIFHEPDYSWAAAKSRVIFPMAPDNIKTPSLRRKEIGRDQEYISNVKFSWFLIEEHGFRVTRQYLRDEEGHKLCVETR